MKKNLRKKTEENGVLLIRTNEIFGKKVRLKDDDSEYIVLDKVRMDDYDRYVVAETSTGKVLVVYADKIRLIAELEYIL